MTELEAICFSCGKTWRRSDMEEINTGRRVHYICPRCYKAGTTDAVCFEADQAEAVRKRGRPRRRKQ